MNENVKKLPNDCAEKASLRELTQEEMLATRGGLDARAQADVDVLGFDATIFLQHDIPITIVP